MDNLIKELKSIQKQIKNIDKHCRETIKTLDSAAEDQDFVDKIGAGYLAAVITSIEDCMNDLAFASAEFDWLTKK